MVTVRGKNFEFPIGCNSPPPTIINIAKFIIFFLCGNTKLPANLLILALHIHYNYCKNYFTYAIYPATAKEVSLFITDISMSYLPNKFVWMSFQHSASIKSMHSYPFFNPRSNVVGVSTVCLTLGLLMKVYCHARSTRMVVISLTS